MEGLRNFIEVDNHSALEEPGDAGHGAGSVSIH